MNIDSNDIMLYATQCVCEIMKDYGPISDLHGLKHNATFLLAAITAYLSEDTNDPVVRKCAVQWQAGLVISQARKIPLLASDAQKGALDTMNDLHKNFVDHCRTHEQLFVQTRIKIENTPSRPLKM